MSILFLAKLTPTLIDAIPDKVSIPELAIIARALEDSGDFDRAVDYASKAVERAKTSNNIYDFTWALRQRAWIYTYNGSRSEGKLDYNKALSVFSENGKDINQPSVIYDRAYTYADWAGALAETEDCKDAQAKLFAFLNCATISLP